MKENKFSFFKSKLSFTHLKYILLLIGIILKSVFKATIEIIWGLVSFTALGALLFYIKEKGAISESVYFSSLGSISQVVIFVQQHLQLFWWAIFLLVLYDNWYKIRELNWSIKHENN